MKNILLLLALITLGINQNSFSQRNCDIKIKLVQPYQDTITDSLILYQIEITNIGTTSVLPTDSFYLYFEINNIKYSLNGKRININKNNFSTNLNAGVSTTTPSLYFPKDSLVSILSLNYICIKLDFVNSTLDTNVSNNTDCFYLRYNFTSIPKKTIKKLIEIIQFNDKIQLINRSKENLNYKITSMDGKTAKSGVLVEFKEVDLSQQNTGIYILNIYNSKENFSKKIFKH